MREITEVHVLIKCHKSVSFPVLTGAMGSEGWGDANQEQFVLKRAYQADLVKTPVWLHH